MAEHLPTMHEALGLVASTTKEKTEDGGQGRNKERLRICKQLGVCCLNTLNSEPVCYTVVDN